MRRDINTIFQTQSKNGLSIYILCFIASILQDVPA